MDTLLMENFSLLELNTPYKLAKWIISLPSIKHKYNFLFRNSSIADLMNLPEDHLNEQDLLYNFTTSRMLNTAAANTIDEQGQDQEEEAFNQKPLDLRAFQSRPYRPKKLALAANTRLSVGDPTTLIALVGEGYEDDYSDSSEFSTEYNSSTEDDEYDDEDNGQQLHQQPQIQQPHQPRSQDLAVPPSSIYDENGQEFEFEDDDNDDNDNDEDEQKMAQDKDSDSEKEDEKDQNSNSNKNNNNNNNNQNMLNTDRDMINSLLSFLVSDKLGVGKKRLTMF
jgi:hypothetical protein